MSKGLPRSMSRGSPIEQEVLKSVIKLNSVAIEVDGLTGVGFGSAVIGDFPEGNILVLGAVSYVQFTKAASASGIQATFDGDYAIGSTATADATITGTDANIVALAALGAATAGVSPIVRSSASGQGILDNTDGSLELNLNLIIDDANISANDQALTASGHVVILYSVLGDD